MIHLLTRTGIVMSFSGCAQDSLGFGLPDHAASAAFLRLLQTMATQPARCRVNYQVEACFDGFSGHCAKPLLVH
jgi:hypothetical protein